MRNKNLLLPRKDEVIYAQNIYGKINKNSLVIGSAGSGKTFGYIQPNICQMNASYIITDPKGEIFCKTSKMLLNAGYDIKVFSPSCDATYQNCSNHYNPFEYLKDKNGNIDVEQVILLTKTLLSVDAYENSEDAASIPDPFFIMAEENLLSALILYTLNFEEPQNQNLSYIVKLLQQENSAQSIKSRFDQIKTIDKAAECIDKYKKFKSAPDKTARAIITTLIIKLNSFTIEFVKNITSTAYKEDENGVLIRDDAQNINLNTINQKKTALFIHMPIMAGRIYQKLATIILGQILNTLYITTKKSKIHTKILLDEFCNIGNIPNFPYWLKTIKDMNVSYSIVVQSIPQLKNRYNELWKDIVNSCDVNVIFGDINKTVVDLALTNIINSKTICQINGVVVIEQEPFSYNIGQAFWCKLHPNYNSEKMSIEDFMRSCKD